MTDGMLANGTSVPTNSWYDMFKKSQLGLDGDVKKALLSEFDKALSVLSETAIQLLDQKNVRFNPFEQPQNSIWVRSEIFGVEIGLTMSVAHFQNRSGDLSATKLEVRIEPVNVQYLFLCNGDNLLSPKEYLGDDVTTAPRGNFAYKTSSDGAAVAVSSIGDPAGTNDLTLAAAQFTELIKQSITSPNDKTSLEGESF